MPWKKIRDILYDQVDMTAMVENLIPPAKKRVVSGLKFNAVTATTVLVRNAQH